MLARKIDSYAASHPAFAKWARERITVFQQTELGSDVAACLVASVAAGLFANGQNGVLFIASFVVMCAVWLVTSLLAGFLKQWLFLFFATLYFVLPQILILPPVGDATASMSETQYFISDILRYIWESPLDAVFPNFDCMIVSYVMLAVCGAVFLAGVRLRRAAKHSELYCRTRLELMD